MYLHLLSAERNGNRDSDRQRECESNYSTFKIANQLSYLSFQDGGKCQARKPSKTSFSSSHIKQKEPLAGFNDPIGIPSALQQSWDIPKE